MSGHSKWSTIKRQKAVTDAKRSSVFTKYARLITIAAREGGKDPSMNFRLRLAIDKAKGVNMPNDNIERAIKSGTGELKGTQSKEVAYEGFGPGRVAVIVQAVTDNTNRTAAEIRSLFQKHGGTMGAQNSVGWMFTLSGVIRLPLDKVDDKEALELGAIDAGAEDVREEDQELVIITTPEKLAAVRTWLEGQRLTNFAADTELLPQTTVAIDDAAREHLYQFYEALEDHPDVTNFYGNDA